METVLIEQATEVSEKDFDKLNLSVRDKDAHPKIILCLNPSYKKHWIFQRFFQRRNIDYDFNGIYQDTVYIHTTYFDNLNNVDKTFLKEAEDTEKFNLLKYNNDFLGMWLDQNYNALWTKQMIDRSHQLKQIPNDFEKVAIGLDPAGTHNRNSDETGIIVAGYKGNTIYVIQEKTGKYSPKQWANIVGDLYKKYNASAVIAQSNFGGDMVEQNLRYQYRR